MMTDREVGGGGASLESGDTWKEEPYMSLYR
jgi:hypothetical protein